MRMRQISFLSDTEKNMSKLFWSSLFTLAAAAAFSLKRYFGGMNCRCNQRLDCKAVVITGATSGIGKALALEVAKRGAQVILACRDMKAAWAVVDEITKETHNEGVYALPLDLTNFKSINEFCGLLSECEFDIYSLVNNAAVFYLPLQTTADGFDVTFQTNYLGPFLLTLKMLPSMAKNGRIVNVSSEAHKLCSSLDIPKQAGLFEVYGHSKACLNLLTLKLASTVDGVSAVNVDPGNVETKIFRNFPLLSNPLLKILLWPIRFLTVKRPVQGAQSVLHAIICPQPANGCYIRDCKEEWPSDFCMNDTNADALWHRSLQWTKMTEEYVLQTNEYSSV
ncbi:retinol dehydrogenase 12-like [Neocloeon triangulifer]|uniref:retinol dehydrogenase 12-like n=1 Tax=Neocloeon triangulifer TaxID=2078957 RepID=UPI00286F11E3|nr:retinol dehydrogenase 12-like [Neocloeon triangulifer]